MNTYTQNFLVIVVVVTLFVWWNRRKENFTIGMTRPLYRQCPNHPLTNVDAMAMQHMGLAPTERLEDPFNVYQFCGMTDAQEELEKNWHVIQSKQGNIIVTGILGMNMLAAKNALWTLLKHKYGRMRALVYAPETWSLHDPDDLAHLEHELRNPQHGRTFIYKANRQRQEGLKLVKNVNVSEAKRDGYVVVQRILEDPYLIAGRKVNIRVYVLVLCTAGKLTVMLYQNGFVYYTKKPYAKHSMDSDAVITSGYVDRDVYKYNPLTLEDLFGYIERKEGDGKAQHLWKNIMFVTRGVIDAIRPHLCQKKSRDGVVFAQMFGADFQLDSKLSAPKILELNKGASATVMDERDGAVKSKLYVDLYQAASAALGENGGFTDLQNGFQEIASWQN